MTLLQLEQTISVVSSKKELRYQPHKRGSSKAISRRSYGCVAVERYADESMEQSVSNPIANGFASTVSPPDSILVCVFQQLDNLKFDLDRLQSGFLLLSQSMDRLNEVVCDDSNCCSWIWSINQNSSLRSTSRSSKSNRYLVVETSGDRENE